MMRKELEPKARGPSGSWRLAPDFGHMSAAGLVANAANANGVPSQSPGLRRLAGASRRPGVATLGWRPLNPFSTPTGLRPYDPPRSRARSRPHDHRLSIRSETHDCSTGTTPLGLMGNKNATVTQGRRLARLRCASACPAPTLGWRTEPRWGSRRSQTGLLRSQDDR